MPRVIVVGGGWAGCAAAWAARQAGAEVILLERTDMLLGTGLVGGIMRNNGRYTAAEELKALGAGKLLELTDHVARHRNIDFTGHRHATLYDVTRIEPLVRVTLVNAGIKLRIKSRVHKVRIMGEKVKAVETEEGEEIPGDVFIDATGTAGPPANCRRYGFGCVMCIYRCPTFGGRLSLCALAGVEEYAALRRSGGLGALSGSCKLKKASLSPHLVQILEKKGVVCLPLPSHLKGKKEHLYRKACQQYALEEYADNLILLDTGAVKIMAPFLPLDDLRRIRGLENASYEDPYAGGIGNSIRFLAMVPREDTLRVKALENVFCAGEKAGPLVGHTEAIVTGTLAGHNAVRFLAGEKLLSLPLSLAVGDFITFSREQVECGEGLYRAFTFSGSVYWERMQRLGLYTINSGIIWKKVEEAGLLDVFAQKIL